ncbi:uncharacterized protein FIBRA_08182 [Fibroporia radiculosa]|uniref:Uncharacterized protein n=1 Tax=Fibroporia radiculosa TaxID=599839 RepID=J4GGR0_9APHY|nr:uncharacterized protein FIBRA_08182 [Fibroporia radiculosa]CCM05943.1 predicted protein [Fibroporia radiculosa]
MIILDEKMSTLLPPPPYSATSQPHQPSARRDIRRSTFADFPPHLLLRFVYEVFPREQPEGQRQTLYWITMSLRLVNRALYIACMHVLRSTYLPTYSTLIRVPYTSDPFPMTSADSALSSLNSLQRETRVLDLFIALKIREDVWTDDSELHLEREESFKDLFDLMQPRARLEDLVRVYGVRDGLVSPSAPATTRAQQIPFALLSVSFSPRKIGLVLTTKQRKRTIVEIVRAREDSLETSARQLTRELRSWVAGHLHYMDL